jgi:FkbM family methyltransferase
MRNVTRKPDTILGRDFIGEVKTRLPRLEVKTIFDVGAHIGIIAIEYSDHFPAATVFSFEPDAANFRRMAANLVGKPTIRRQQIGLGATQGTATLFLDPVHPSMGRLVDTADGYTESVTIDTVDHFCEVHRVPHIDIMKIDTEGHEIQVLVGAREMLKSASIGVIKAEVAADPDMNYHTSFFSVCELLNPFGYRLFGLYEQCENEFSPGPRIRRFDAAFVSATLLTQHGVRDWIAAPPPGTVQP